jgi:hypothetical protein
MSGIYSGAAFSERPGQSTCAHAPSTSERGSDMTDRNRPQSDPLSLKSLARTATIDRKALSEALSLVPDTSEAPLAEWEQSLQLQELEAAKARHPSNAEHTKT